MACSVFSDSARTPIIESAPVPFRKFGDSPARVSRAGVIMPVRCDAIGRGEVLAWPALRRTSKGDTIPQHLQSEKVSRKTPHHYPSGVLCDRSWGFLAHRKVAEVG